MNWESRPLFVDLLVAPRATLAILSERAPIVRPALWLGALAALVQVWQLVLVHPILAADPLLADAAADAVAKRSIAVLNLAAVVLAAVGPLARAATLAFVLSAIASMWSAAANWRRIASLLLHLEFVFWLEGLCTTVLLWRLEPQTLEAMRGVELHAGLDLLLRDTPGRIAGAVGVFTLAWGTLFVLGLAQWMRRRPALALAMPVWATLVLLRQIARPG